MAIKMKKQLKRKITIWQSQPLSPSKPWKPNWKANTRGVPSHQNKKGKVKYFKEKKCTSIVVKSNNVTLTSCNHDIKYFRCLHFDHIASQCPNKKVMVMKAKNEVEVDEEDGKEKMTPLKDDVCVEYLVEGEAFMVMRALHMHIKLDYL